MTTFSEADVNKLKHLIKEGIQVTQEVDTLKEGLRDTVKAIAEEMDLNAGTLNKAIRVAHKASLGTERDKFDELETILEVVGKTL